MSDKVGGRVIYMHDSFPKFVNSLWYIIGSALLPMPTICTRIVLSYLIGPTTIVSYKCGEKSEVGVHESWHGGMPSK